MPKVFYNSKGQGYHQSSAGTYPINDGDPQNDYEDEELEEEREDSNGED